MPDPTPGEQRWAAVCEEARAAGIDPKELERLIVLPLRRGGAGWPWWAARQTTEALAAWLRRLIQEMKGAK